MCAPLHDWVGRGGGQAVRCRSPARRLRAKAPLERYDSHTRHLPQLAAPLIRRLKQLQPLYSLGLVLLALAAAPGGCLAGGRPALVLGAAAGGAVLAKPTLAEGQLRSGQPVPPA